MNSVTLLVDGPDGPSTLEIAYTDMTDAMLIDCAVAGHSEAMRLLVDRSIPQGSLRRLSGVLAEFRYSDDQERDENGRWSGEGGGAQAGGPSKGDSGPRARAGETAAGKTGRELFTTMTDKIRDATEPRDFTMSAEKRLREQVLDASVRGMLDDPSVREWAASTGIAGDVAMRAAAAEVIDDWSNFGAQYPPAIAIQYIAAEVAGIDTAPFDRHVEEFVYVPQKDREFSDFVAEVDAYRSEKGPAIARFTELEYERTQAMLAEAGIKSITMYRGLSTQALDGERTVITNPLSSWTTDRQVADTFAEMTSDGDYATVITATIPADMVQSTAITGRGSLGEYELVVRGGVPIPVRVENSRMDE